MKCNIWISNTSYIFDYNSISFHDNQLKFGIKVKRTFLTKYIKLQIPWTFGYRDNQWFIEDGESHKNQNPREWLRHCLHIE